MDVSLISVPSGRERWIYPGDAPVWVSGGRWGRRRVRVTECQVAKAEDLYTAMTRRGHEIGPGSWGSVKWRFGDTEVNADWEIRDNHVWRHGRTFFRCGRCGRLATRLYMALPAVPAWFACRRCLGLTYASRTTNNYKDRSFLGFGGLGLTHRRSAQIITHGERERRREASLARQAERRRLRSP